MGRDHFRGDGYLPRPPHDEDADAPAADLAGGICSHDGIGTEDGGWAEEQAASESVEGCYRRRSPAPLLELNLVIANDEIQPEIASTEDRCVCHYERRRTVSDLLRSKSWSFNKIAVIVNTTKGTLTKADARSRQDRRGTTRRS
jgi:hypothetical protein